MGELTALVGLLIKEGFDWINRGEEWDVDEILDRVKTTSARVRARGDEIRDRQQ